MMSTLDERMLRSMGISPDTPPPADLHKACVEKWHEEREARCIAEQAARMAWTHLEDSQRVSESHESDANMWQCRAFYLGAAAVALFICLLVAVFRR